MRDPSKVVGARASIQSAGLRVRAAYMKPWPESTSKRFTSPRPILQLSLTKRWWMSGEPV